MYRDNPPPAWAAYTPGSWELDAEGIHYIERLKLQGVHPRIAIRRTETFIIENTGDLPVVATDGFNYRLAPEDYACLTRIVNGIYGCTRPRCHCASCVTRRRIRAAFLGDEEPEC